MSLRIAYFCMESVFSVRPLEALLQAGHDVRCVLRPIGPLSSRNDAVLKRHRGFDLAMRKLLGMSEHEPRTNPLALAADKDIPAWLCGDVNTPAVHKLLVRERIDLIVIAFFNQLLKRPTWETAPLGAVNLHPSLLPRHRGPAPLFWTFKDGDDETGLSFHRIAAGEDNGALLKSVRVPLDLDTAGEDLVDDLAAIAAANISSVVNDVAAGVPGLVQDEAAATRAPRPTPADVVIDASLPAERIYRFARGVGRWNTLTTHAFGQELRILDALDLDNRRIMPGQHVLIGDDLLLAVDDGVVCLRVRRL
jgi:methionyl-tRNA formyltransferase